jgi:PAS domain-containing protein
MRLLANPVLLRAAVVFCFAAFSFLMGLIFIRLLRKSITSDAEISSEAAPTSLEALPVHLYNTVIQQLKQQKQELEVQSQAEQQRARTTESLSQAVLSNLSCGVLVFGTNGLVKTSNPAAKTILGFASTTGMDAEDIFRGAEIRSHNTTPRSSSCNMHADETTADLADAPLRLADEVDVVLHEDCARRQVEADYETPSGEQRVISVTISPVPATEGNLLGVACLISDLSEIEQIRRQQQLRGEISAEMALQLRTSLTTISGIAQQLAGNRDPEAAKRLASDIAEQAAQLDQTIGGFLTERRAAQSAAAAND